MTLSRSIALAPAGAAVATDPDAVMAALAAGTHAAVRAPATLRAMRRPLGESDECPSWGCGGASGAQRGTSAPGRSSRSSRAAESDRGRRGGPAWWSPATMSGLARGRIRRPRGAVPGAPTADLARRVPRAGCVWAGGVLCSVTFRPQTPARRCRSCEHLRGSRPHRLRVKIRRIGAKKSKRVKIRRIGRLVPPPLPPLCQCACGRRDCQRQAGGRSLD